MRAQAGRAESAVVAACMEGGLALNVLCIHSRTSLVTDVRMPKLIGGLYLVSPRMMIRLHENQRLRARTYGKSCLSACR